MSGSGYPKMPTRPSAAVGGEWVAVEKLHGAQLALARRDGLVRASARKRDLEPDDLSGFFGLDRIWPELVVAYAALEAALPELGIAYGELVGESDGVPVQPGTDYGPLAWHVFDLRITTEIPGVPDADAAWLGVDEVLAACAGAGVHAAPLLARGSYQQMAALALPTSSTLGGAAEGVVLRPARRWHDADGPRPIFKRKHPDFAEDGDWAGPRPGLGVGGMLAELAAQSLTPARIASAVSKLGPPQAVGEEALAEEVVADVLDEVTGHVGALDAGERERLAAAVRPAARRLVERLSHER